MDGVRRRFVAPGLQPRPLEIAFVDVVLRNRERGRARAVDERVRATGRDVEQLTRQHCALPRRRSCGVDAMNVHCALCRAEIYMHHNVR